VRAEAAAAAAAEIEAWAAGYLGQWRSMGPRLRARFVSGLVHFARMNETADGAAALQALRLIKAESGGLYSEACIADRNTQRRTPHDGGGPGLLAASS